MPLPARVLAITTGLALATLLAGSAGAAGFPPCGPYPTRQAFAASFGLDGKPLWTTPLPITQGGDGWGLPPMVDGAVTYLTVEGTVTAVGTADGHVVWQAKQGSWIYNAWRYGSVLAVLSRDRLNREMVTGYETATGAIDWTHVSRVGSFGGAQTSDGGVAWMRADGVLQVLDLATGRLRWSTRVAKNMRQLQIHGASVIATAGAVLFAGRGALSAYDLRTGRRRWLQSPLPEQPLVVVSDGVAVLTTQSSSRKPQRVVGMSLANGKVLWQRRFTTTTWVGLVATSAGVLLTGGADPIYREYMLAPRTGKTRWSAPARLAGSPTYAETIVGAHLLQQTFASTLVDRDLRTGHVRWQVGLSGAAARSYIVAGSATQAYLVGPADDLTKGALRAYALDDGHALWTVTAQSTLQTQPDVGSGRLVLAEADGPNVCPA